MVEAQKKVHRSVHGSERVKPNNGFDEDPDSNERLKTGTLTHWMLFTDNDNKDRLQMVHVVASATQRGVRWVHSSGKKEEEEEEGAGK